MTASLLSSDPLLLSLSLFLSSFALCLFIRLDVLPAIMSRTAVLLLLLSCLLLLSTSVSAATAAPSPACNPCVAGGCYGYDFRGLPELSVSASDDVYYFAFCDNTAECGQASWSAGQVCLSSIGSLFSLGPHQTAAWQLLDPSQPAAGLQLSLTGGDDYIAQCYNADSKVNVSCGVGNSSLQLVQAGSKQSCTWSFSVQGAAVCQQLSSSGAGQRSSSSAGGRGFQSSSADQSSTAGESSSGGGGGGGGGDGCLLPVLLAIILTLSFCFLVSELSHGPGSLFALHV